jgi:hypothetical protein
MAKSQTWLQVAVRDDVNQMLNVRFRVFTL